MNQRTRLLDSPWNSLLIVNWLVARNYAHPIPVVSQLSPIRLPKHQILTSSTLTLATAAGERVCRSHPPERRLAGVPGTPPVWFWCWLPLDTLEA
jgi:hypothetical protein